MGEETWMTTRRRKRHTTDFRVRTRQFTIYNAEVTLNSACHDILGELKCQN